MIKPIKIIILLFFGSVMFAYSLGTPEWQDDDEIVRELREEYNIRVAPISLHYGTYSHNYVFINPDTILLTKMNFQLSEISLINNSESLRHY